MITKANGKRDAYGLIGQRVELAPSTDRWMMGDRYGEIVAYAMRRSHVRVKMDRSGKTIRIHGDLLQPIN